MNNFSLYKLIGFVLTPFLILFVIWAIIGEEIDVFFIQFINSLLSSILITIIIATLLGNILFVLTQQMQTNIYQVFKGCQKKSCMPRDFSFYPGSKTLKYNEPNIL